MLHESTRTFKLYKLQTLIFKRTNQTFYMWFHVLRQLHGLGHFNTILHVIILEELFSIKLKEQLISKTKNNGISLTKQLFITCLKLNGRSDD